MNDDFYSYSSETVKGDSAMPSQSAVRSGSPSILKDTNAKRLDRPKSTPAGLKVTFGNNSTAHYASLRGRPHTTPIARDTYECERVYQVEHEPTRKHTLDTHLPSKRNRQPPWQKHLEHFEAHSGGSGRTSPMRPVSVGNGYVLSKSKDKVHMYIKTGDFFEPLPDDSQSFSRLADPERDALIAQLQEQINDLTLYLEEEKLNHKDTRRRLEDQMRDRLTEQKSDHNDLMRHLEDKNKDDLEEQKLHYERELNDHKTTSENAIGKMKGEIEFLHGSFSSYKTTLTVEMQEKWALKEEELRQQNEEEIEDAMHKLKTRLIQEKAGDRQEQEREFQRERQLQQREHKKDMDSLVRKFSSAAADMEKLKKTTAELQDLKSAYKLLSDKYDHICQQHATITHELADTKLKLMGFEEHFQEKVAAVDDKYKEQIHDLMMKNTELRRQYNKKCGQLFDEKSESEKSLVQNIQNAKDAMHAIITTRNRVNVSLVAGDVTLDDKPRQPFTRPLSAPVTRPEAVNAHLTAAQTDHLTNKRSNSDIHYYRYGDNHPRKQRPQTCFGRFEGKDEIRSTHVEVGDNAESLDRALQSLG